MERKKKNIAIIVIITTLLLMIIVCMKVLPIRLSAFPLLPPQKLTHEEVIEIAEDNGMTKLEKVFGTGVVENYEEFKSGAVLVVHGFDEKGNKCEYIFDPYNVENPSKTMIINDNWLIN